MVSKISRSIDFSISYLMKFFTILFIQNILHINILFVDLTLSLESLIDINGVTASIFFAFFPIDNPNFFRLYCLCIWKNKVICFFIFY